MNVNIYVGLPATQQHYVKHGVKMHDPTDIIDCACKLLKIERSIVLSKCRKRPVVECRQIAIGIMLLNNPMLGLVKVGKIFNRDHSTIIYARESFNDLYEYNKDFAKKVDLVRQLTNDL